MEILAIVKLAHLAGLIMGLGGAMLADYTTLTRGVIRPVSPYTIHQMELLSHIVAVGLGLLWISGIAIIWINTAANPEYITNQKIWAKVIIVFVLTLNGIYIHKTILPALQKASGRRLFDEVAKRNLAIMTLCGSFSFVSWTIPFILARASALNYVTPVQNILAVYLVCLLVVWFGMFAAMSTILRVQRFARETAMKNPRANYGRRVFDYVAKRDLVIMTVLGSLFLFAWTMVFVVGRASAVNAMPPLLHIIALYLICLGAVACMMFTLLRAMSKVRAVFRRILKKAAPMTLLPNSPWEISQPIPRQSQG